MGPIWATRIWAHPFGTQLRSPCGSHMGSPIVTHIGIFAGHKTNNTNDPQKKYRLGTVSKNILLEGFNQFHGANPTLNSDVDQESFGKVTKHNKHDSHFTGTK